MFGSGPQKQGGGGSGRRTLRDRKVSSRMGVVDDNARKQAAQARLDSLDNDNEAPEATVAAAGEDDDEYAEESEDDDPDANASKRSKAKKGLTGAKRKLKGGPKDGSFKSFARILDEAALDQFPAGFPTYLTAAVGPSTATAPRKFCSICGTFSEYTCARCGQKYCCRKCYKVHVETRCQKFIS
ncbi:MAG: hypothetical protein WDW38_002435 [Sanguina aurantia]